MHFLVTFYKDWCDEFAVQGMKLYTLEEWAIEDEILKTKRNYWVSAYFGTNQGWEEETLADFENSYEVKSISESTYAELISIGAREKGTFFAPSELLTEESE